MLIYIFIDLRWGRREDVTNYQPMLHCDNIFTTSSSSLRTSATLAVRRCDVEESSCILSAKEVQIEVTQGTVLGGYLRWMLGAHTSHRTWDEVFGGQLGINIQSPFYLGISCCGILTISAFSVMTMPI